ncbi:AT hook motif domain containing protein [Musa troglodytarum]|uniref:AT-hook motif nuclear-localized protein n=1 Tax=Musa troglodytarum TaxID=320322 RepID=A0A9E7K137_9LILI|nr:AT hook motif domain containing protein [Musa troglodytarum]URD99617.1 AT hook motif domain containing protein [Musa troglodytarum]
MADPAAYFMRREIADQDAGAQLGSQVAPPPDNRLNLAGPSSTIRSPEFQMESLSGVLSSHGVSRGELVKRRRGRPRKYGPDAAGAVALAFSPTSSTGPALMSGGSDAAAPKRRRGRPPGTGRKQKLALHGEWFSGSAGSDLIPHVITIPIGEDIATKIMSFSQQGPRAICILSASGVVSTATLCHYTTTGDTVTYKGHYQILCLSGSYMASDADGSLGRSGWLNISLFALDGRVIGGSVAGPLLASSPVQVVVVSFVLPGPDAKNKGIAIPESEHLIEDGQPRMPSSLPTQNLSPSQVGGWSSSRQVDASAHLSSIDLTHG